MEYNVVYGRQQQQQGRSFDPSGSEQQQYGRPRVTLAVNTTGIEDAMWQMTLQQQYEGAEGDMGPYPERPGEPDCSYYMRTGACGFGMGCRYNHPPNRKQATSTARNKGEYPERPGQPECQYYMKTGTCKFGGSCKFHHPRDKAGVAGRTTLNVLGYPLRPNERDCAYYLRTGQCKFGATCKFHHPQPVSALVPVRGTSLFTPVHSPSTPGPQPYPGGLPTWPIARAPFIQSPRWQGPSSYASVILPQGLLSVPSWSSYPVSCFLQSLIQALGYILFAVCPILNLDSEYSKVFFPFPSPSFSFLGKACRQICTPFVVRYGIQDSNMGAQGKMQI